MGYILSAVAVMMLVTYLPRMLPLTLFRQKIKNRWLQSFLAYVPFAVLSAMTFPAILYSTGNLITAMVGLAVAVVLSFYHRGLLTVALGAVGAVLVCEFVLTLLL